MLQRWVLFSDAEDDVDEVDEEGVSGGVSCGLGLADRNSKLCNSMHNLLLCTSSSPIRKTLDPNFAFFVRS